MVPTDVLYTHGRLNTRVSRSNTNFLFICLAIPLGILDDPIWGALFLHVYPFPPLQSLIQLLEPHVDKPSAETHPDVAHVAELLSLVLTPAIVWPPLEKVFKKYCIFGQSFFSVDG